jgi:hypothetical protein
MGACNYQFLLPDLLEYDQTTYGDFVDALACPSCGESIHPEDAVMEYFSHISPEESPLHPLSIGGYCLNDTIDVPLGSTREEGIIQEINTTVSVEGEEVQSSSSSLPLRAGIARVWDSEGQSLEEMHGELIQPRVGPAILLNDEVVADVDVVTEDDGTNKIAFMTSSRNGMVGEEVTFGYHLSLYSPRFQGPPWSELLREGIKSVYEGNPRTAYPSFITAFDNFLLRQLFRTAKLQGESMDDFDGFIDGLRGWKNYVKEGLEEYTGERLTLHNHTVYENFRQVRKRRNVELVHVSYDDDIPEISQDMAINDFKDVLSAMIEIYDICVEKREEIRNE